MLAGKDSEAAWQRQLLIGGESVMHSFEQALNKQLNFKNLNHSVVGKLREDCQYGRLAHRNDPPSRRPNVVRPTG